MTNNRLHFCHSFFLFHKYEKIKHFILPVKNKRFAHKRQVLQSTDIRHAGDNFKHAQSCLCLRDKRKNREPFRESRYNLRQPERIPRRACLSGQMLVLDSETAKYASLLPALHKKPSSSTKVVKVLSAFISCSVDMLLIFLNRKS